jgi:hypothetical protein
MVLQTMTDFINCPFCSGHEKVSRDAAVVINELIDGLLPKLQESALKIELENIRNVILNTQDREKPIDPLLE